MIVSPIPLHPGRERERGFNQSDLLAEIFSKHFGLAKINLLERKINNQPQAKSKNYQERQENMKNCFSLVRGGSVKNKNIILVDDVFTSGATLREAARTLKKAGAGKIIGLVVAKAD